MSETRQIVIPGEIVATAQEMRPGMNTYQEGGDIYALRLGVKSVRGDRVNVISLSGRYEPFRGDMVIGTVVEVGPSNWYVDIGAANDVGMHVNDVPWRVEFGETSRYLAVGDTVLLKIVHVDELKKAQVSMKDRQCRKLTGGLILEVAPTKVPRIVGRNGSMISMLKDATNVRLFVGQNGVLWMDGEPEDVQLALEALRKIEAEAHTTGLTDRMKAWLEERRPLALRPKRAEAEEAPEETEREAPPPRREREERRERPRRFEGDERPRRREEAAERPRRSFEEARSGRGREGEDEPQFGRERPRRSFEEERPRRSFAEERPRRSFEGEERPRGSFEEDRPRRTFEEPRGRSREGDDEPQFGRERPRRSLRDEVEEERPRRRLAEDAEERPVRRVRDAVEPAPRARREESDEEDERPRRSDDEGRSGGGGRRRRGGRGRRGRGGSGRREE